MAKLAPWRLTTRDKRRLQLVRVVLRVELLVVVLGCRLACRLHLVLRAVLVERRGDFGRLGAL